MNSQPSPLGSRGLIPTTLVPPSVTTGETNFHPSTRQLLSTQPDNRVHIGFNTYESLHSQQSPSVRSREEPLSAAVNKALQKQRIMREILHSPYSQNRVGRFPLHLLDHMPVPPFGGGPGQIDHSSYASRTLGMLPTHQYDSLRVTPNSMYTANFHHQGPRFTPRHPSLSLGFTSMPNGMPNALDGVDHASLKRLHEKQNAQNHIPQQKRRKTVNFNLDGSRQAQGDLLPRTSDTKATFPLPSVHEVKGKAIAVPVLVSYKNIWKKLRNAKGKNELFRRRLQRGNVPIAK